MDACPAEADVALDLSSLAPFVPAPQDRPVITPSLSVLRGLVSPLPRTRPPSLPPGCALASCPARAVRLPPTVALRERPALWRRS